MKNIIFSCRNFCSNIFANVLIFVGFDLIPIYQQGSFINHHSVKKSKVRFLEDDLEFLDNIAPSCSTDQYFISSKYEVLTPSYHEDLKNQYFGARGLQITKGNNKGNQAKSEKIYTFFKNLGTKFSTRKKNFFSKQLFLRHTPCLKSTKMNFYGNPITDFVSRLPYIAISRMEICKKWRFSWHTPTGAIIYDYANTR